ncbi:glycosyltransferase domain-containing protein [Sinomicrobium sp. M5D2P9]
MKVITVVTDVNNFYFRKFLVPSCEFFGFHLVILNPTKPWESHRIKDQVLVPYLESLKSPDEIILFTDGYDAMMLNGVSEVVRRYEQFQKPMVFSSEANCWPEPELIKIYNRVSRNYSRFLNSGGFICKVQDILNILKENSWDAPEILRSFDIKNEQIDSYESKYKWSNQYFWTLQYFSKPGCIEIDTESRIFITTDTPLDLFSTEIHEYARLGEHANVYKIEKKRIMELIDVLEVSLIPHLHFFNPITTHIFKELYIHNLFPDRIAKILKYDKIKKAEVVQF